MPHSLSFHVGGGAEESSPQESRLAQVVLKNAAGEEGRWASLRLRLARVMTESQLELELRGEAGSSPELLQLVETGLVTVAVPILESLLARHWGF